MKKNIALITILLSGLTGCGGGAMATRGTGTLPDNDSRRAAACQAATSPEYGHNEGPFGALAKTLMGVNCGTPGSR
jgi:hypothetical protein